MNVNVNLENLIDSLGLELDGTSHGALKYFKANQDSIMNMLKEMDMLDKNGFYRPVPGDTLSGIERMVTTHQSLTRQGRDFSDTTADSTGSGDSKTGGIQEILAEVTDTFDKLSAAMLDAQTKVKVASAEYNIASQRQ